jgi:SAM-dependent methyltransferase
MLDLSSTTALNSLQFINKVRILTLTTKSPSTKDFKVWQENIPEELHFWNRWMTEEQFRPYREPRLNPDRELPPHICSLLNGPRGTTFKILDVGSGPLSNLGTTYPGHSIELYLTDPLADEYNQMLAQLGMPERAGITKANGEEIDLIFPEYTFDLVHSNNALDHTYNPLLCLQKMLKLCKPGGWVFISGVQNEGEREHYQGLHQWNFMVKGTRLRLWNLQTDIMVDEHLPGISQLEAYPVDRGDGLPFFHARIQKSDLNWYQANLEELRSQLNLANIQLSQAQNTIQAMESSKFWKLRRAWFHFKRVLGLQ